MQGNPFYGSITGHKRLLPDIETAFKETASLLNDANTIFEDSNDQPYVKKRAKITLIKLKGLNKSMHVEVQKKKDQLKEENTKLHELNLKLHNLLYEKKNKMKEIETCKEYKAGDKGVEAIFENQIPSDLLQSANGNVHESKKLRLNYELNERKRLCEKVKEMKEFKENLIKRNKERRAFLNSLQTHVVKLKELGGPLNQLMSSNQNQVLGNTELAQKLPAALYVLYYQSIMFCHINPKGPLEVNIVGDKVAADQWLLQQSQNALKNLPGVTNESIMQDADDELDVFAKHPLNIQITFTPTQAPYPISISFYYLYHLQVVTVVENDKQRKYGTSVLNCLFPNDTGTSFPNPATSSLLPEGFLFDADESIGKPYQFAQKLGGLQFLPEGTPNLLHQHENLVPTPKQILKKFLHLLELRLKKLIVLPEQITQLQRNILPAAPPGFAVDSFSTKLTQFSIISQKQYEDLFNQRSFNNKPTTLYHLEKDLIYHCLNTLFLSFTVEYLQNTCDVIVYISPNFPLVPPFFSLLTPKQTTSFTFPEFVLAAADTTAKTLATQSRSFNQQIMEIESSINLSYQLEKEEHKNYLLAIQIYKLLKLFDEYYKK